MDELTYVELQRREDTIEGHAIRRYWKGHYFRELPDAALEALLEHDPLVAAGFQAYGGAIAEVPDDATAFSQRDTAFEYVAATRWTDPAEDDDRIAPRPRIRRPPRALRERDVPQRAHRRGRCRRARAFSPAKLARLTALKNQWDPANIFHLNQNIPPS